MADVKRVHRAAEGVDQPSGLQPPAPIAANRATYTPPRLRYLGKVADLTFGNTGSKGDGGLHTGHNHQPG